jgi:hypothetical protein
MLQPEKCFCLVGFLWGFFGGTGVLTQALSHLLKQALNHLSHSTCPFLCWVFSKQALSRITGVGHQSPAQIFCLFVFKRINQGIKNIIWYQINRKHLFKFQLNIYKDIIDITHPKEYLNNCKIKNYVKHSKIWLSTMPYRIT